MLKVDTKSKTSCQYGSQDNKKGGISMILVVLAGIFVGTDVRLV